MRMLYNNADPDIDVNTDVIALLQYINEFTKSLGVNRVIVDDRICYSVLSGMRRDFPHVDGIDGSSVFKKLANFLTYFIAGAPIQSAFTSDCIGEKLANISNHQNAIVGLQIVLDCLHGASIEQSDGSKTLIIENRVRLSGHSYIDIIDALSKVTPSTNYKMVTVFLEQIVYKTNPNLQYEPIDL